MKQEEYNYKVKELEVNRMKKNLESSVVTSTIQESFRKLTRSRDMMMLPEKRNRL